MNIEHKGLKEAAAAAAKEGAEKAAKAPKKKRKGSVSGTADPFIKDLIRARVGKGRAKRRVNDARYINLEIDQNDPRAQKIIREVEAEQAAAAKKAAKKKKKKTQAEE